MEKSLDYDYILKYILVGDTSVGKSTMLNKFLNDAFTAESNPTMGVEFATKKINVDGTNIKIQIWDTAGQESFRTITRAYYKNAIGVILVYDLSNPDTLKSIDSWLQQIHDNSNETAEIMIVGNKSDLAPPPSKSPKQGIDFLACSAKTGNNIGKVFTGMTRNILKKIQKGIINTQNTAGVKRGNGGKGGSGDSPMKLAFDKDEGNGQRSCCGR